MNQWIFIDGLCHNSKLEIEWLSNNQQCKQIESCYNSLSKKCICPKEEQKQHLIDMMKGDEELGLYEKPKREITLEEAGGIAAGLCQHLEAKEQAMFIAGFIECAKYQSKRMYSKEELLAYGKKCFYKGFEKAEKDDANCYIAFREEMEDLSRWFEQFKKK